MLVSETYRCARSLEAVENYARADAPLVEGLEELVPPVSPAKTRPPETTFEYDMDGRFWSQALHRPEAVWGLDFVLHTMVVCEWVARVPGLFWSEAARKVRRQASGMVESIRYRDEEWYPYPDAPGLFLSPTRGDLRNLTTALHEATEYESDDWVAYSPQGKSSKVLGGVGTLRFPPTENGVRLVTLSGSHNASAGVPALVFPEVWEYHKLLEGDLIGVRARWQQMSFGWVERFPSIRGIPRGYLVLDRPEQVIYKNATDQPVQFHPCTVMEYSKGDAILYDFVYATADTRVPNYRARMRSFFADYKKWNERYGRYLLAADISDPDPLWDAEYSSPIELRRAEAGAKSQLELLEERVRAHAFHRKTVDELVQLLANNYDVVGLKRLSNFVQIPSAHWYTGGRLADAVVDLVKLCLDRNKVEELIDRIALDNPELIS